MVAMMWWGNMDRPSNRNNALVVHVVVGSCDAQVPPLTLMSEKSGGLLGSRTVVEPVGLVREPGCGRPAGTDGGQRIQVWATPGRTWKPDASLSLLAGADINNDPKFASPPGSRLRIDHHHVLLGVVDQADRDLTFAAAAAVPGYVETLADRQGCEKRLFGACGADWRHADLYTLEATAER